MSHGNAHPQLGYALSTDSEPENAPGIARRTIALSPELQAAMAETDRLRGEWWDTTIGTVESTAALHAYRTAQQQEGALIRGLIRAQPGHISEPED